MANRSENIKITDKLGFIHEVKLDHSPHFGFSTAYYDGSIIHQMELGRILEPIGDDDREWEMHEERYAEWTDEIKTSMVPACERHFNSKLKQ